MCFDIFKNNLADGSDNPSCVSYNISIQNNLAPIHIGGVSRNPISKLPPDPVFHCVPVQEGRSLELHHECAADRPRHRDAIEGFGSFVEVADDFLIVYDDQCVAGGVENRVGNSAAEIDRRRREDLKARTLRRQLEQAFDEFDLSFDVFDLPLPDDVHRLVASEGSRSRLEREKTQAGHYTPFYEPVILLDHIIEVLDQAQFTGTPENRSFSQFSCLRRVGSFLIDINHPRPRNTSGSEDLPEKTLGRPSIPLLTEHEFDSLPSESTARYRYYHSFFTLM